jgi:hypothetical protein
VEEGEERVRVVGEGAHLPLGPHREDHRQAAVALQQAHLHTGGERGERAGGGSVGLLFIICLSRVG